MFSMSKTLTSLAYAGLGSFLGFLAVVFGYSVDREYLVYLIPLGAIFGFVLGMKSDEELRSSPASFLAGVIFTTLLVFLWPEGIPLRAIIWVLYVLALFWGLAVKPSGFGDSVLTFPAYLGGFALLLQLFKGYGPLQEVEGALTGVIFTSGKLSVVILSASLVRWTFEKFKRFTFSR